MKKNIEKLEEIAYILKKEKKEILSKTLMRGKICKEVREEINSYNEFKDWVKLTEYSISTINRDINRYEVYELMKNKTGKLLVEDLSVVLIAWINKLKEYNSEKFMELIVLIDNGLDKAGIKKYLEDHITEESYNLKGSDLREYLEELEKETSKIDIRKVNTNISKKIMKSIKKALNLISQCTKLDVVKRNIEMRKKIETINYGMEVVNIS